MPARQDSIRSPSSQSHEARKFEKAPAEPGNPEA